jgi:hypothetical protein
MQESEYNCLDTKDRVGYSPISEHIVSLKVSVNRLLDAGVLEVLVHDGIDFRIEPTNEKEDINNIRYPA